jgi:Transglycosylase SLT domain
MSGSIDSIIAAPQGIDVLSGLKRWQELNQGNAQTGLLGQQATAAGINNELGRISANLYEDQIGQIAPNALRGVTPPSAAPGGGAFAGGAQPPPQQQGTIAGLPVSGGGQGGAAGAADGGAGGDTGDGTAASNQPPTAATHSPGMPPPGQPIGSQVSPFGAVQTLYGVPLPGGLGLQILRTAATAPDKAGGMLKDFMQERRQRLFELLSQPNWQQGVTQAYQEGWMDTPHYQAMLNTPQQRQAYLHGLSSPTDFMNLLEKYAGKNLTLDANGNPVLDPGLLAASGATAKTEANARVPAAVATAKLTPTALPGGGFGPPASLTGQPAGFDADGNPLPAGGAASGGGGGAPAQGAPGGGATNGPPSIPRATSAAILSVPPTLQGPVMAAAARAGLPPEAVAPWIASLHHENGFANKDGASGEIGIGQVMPGTGAMYGYSEQQLRDTPTNLEASAKIFGDNWHKSGGDVGKTVAGYNTGGIAGTPTAGYLPDVNGRLSQWGYPGATNQPAPGVTQRTTPGGAVYTTDTRPQQAEAYKADQAMVPELTATANTLAGVQTRNLETRDLINKLPQAGAAGGARTAAANWVQTFIAPIPGMGTAAAQFISDAARLPPADLAAELEKLQITSAGAQENLTVGQRGGLGLTQLFMKSNPGFGIPQDAGRSLANMNIIGTQMGLDYARMRAQVPSSQPGYLDGTANYNPGTNFDAAWVSQPNEQNYFAAVQALNGKPANEWMATLGTGPQRDARIHAVLGILRRADPTATVKWDDGNSYPVNRVQ